jgi:hypothetical protein
VRGAKISFYLRLVRRIVGGTILDGECWGRKVGGRYSRQGTGIGGRWDREGLESTSGIRSKS